MNLPLEVSATEIKARLEAGERLHLLDVRTPEEHAVASIAGSELMPMDTVAGHLQQLEAVGDLAPIIVICHHGVRSLHVATWLRGQGIENCQSMSGGIERWSTDIDRGVPRY